MALEELHPAMVCMFLPLENTSAKLILTLVFVSGKFIKFCSKNLLSVTLVTDSKRGTIEKSKRETTSFGILTCSPVYSKHTAFTENCIALGFSIIQRNTE